MFKFRAFADKKVDDKIISDRGRHRGKKDKMVLNVGNMISNCNIHCCFSDWHLEKNRNLLIDPLTFNPLPDDKF